MRLPQLTLFVRLLFCSSDESSLLSIFDVVVVDGVCVPKQQAKNEKSFFYLLDCCVYYATVHTPRLRLVRRGEGGKVRRLKVVLCQHVEAVRGPKGGRRFHTSTSK